VRGNGGYLNTRDLHSGREWEGVVSTGVSGDLHLRKSVKEKERERKGAERILSTENARVKLKSYLRFG